MAVALRAGSRRLTFLAVTERTLSIPRGSISVERGLVGPTSNCLAADARCDQYLVVHNRDGRHVDFNHRVKALLNDVLAAGKARRVDVWDRQKLLRKAFDRLATMLATAFRAHSATLFTY